MPHGGTHDPRQQGELQSGVNALVDALRGIFGQEPTREPELQGGISETLFRLFGPTTQPVEAVPRAPGGRELTIPTGDPRTSREVEAGVAAAKARARRTRKTEAPPAEGAEGEQSLIEQAIAEQRAAQEELAASNLERSEPGSGMVVTPIPGTNESLVLPINPTTGEPVGDPFRVSQTPLPREAGTAEGQLALQREQFEFTQEQASIAREVSAKASQDALFQNLLFNLTPQNRLQGLAGLSRTIQGVNEQTITDFLRQAEQPTVPSGLLEQALAQQGIISEGRETTGGRLAEASSLSVEDIITSGIAGTIPGTESSEFLANIFSMLEAGGELPVNIGEAGVDFLPNVQGMLARGEIAPGEAEILNAVLGVAGFDPKLLQQRFSGTGGQGGGVRPGFRTNVIRR